MTRINIVLAACFMLAQADMARSDGFDDWLAGNPTDENLDGNFDVIDYYLSDPNAFIAESGLDLDGDGDTDFDDYFIWVDQLDITPPPLPEPPEAAPPFNDWQADGGFDADLSGAIDIVDYYVIFPDAWLAEVPEDLDGDGDEDFDDHILWITQLGIPLPPPPEDDPLPASFDDWLATDPPDQNFDGILDHIDWYLTDPNAWVIEAAEDLNGDGNSNLDDYFIWVDQLDITPPPLPEPPEAAPPFSDWQADGGFDADLSGVIDIIDYYIIFPDAWLAEVPEDLDGDGDEDFDDHILWITQLGIPLPPPPDDPPPASFDDWLATDPPDQNFDGILDHIDWYITDPNAWLIEAAEDLNGDGNADFDDYFIWLDQLDITPPPLPDAPPTPAFSDWELADGFDANFDFTVDIIDYYLVFPDAWLAEVPEDLNGDGQFDNDDHILWTEVQVGDILPPPLLVFDDWAISGTARDFNFDGILDDLDYYITNGDAWVVEAGEDLDSSLNIDLADFILWTLGQVLIGPPVGDPPLPVWTFDQFLADHLGLSWNGDELIDNLDYWFADFSAWFHGPEARDIDGSGIGYTDWTLWQDEVAVFLGPPDDGESEPFAGNGFVEEIILEAAGGGTLIMRQLPPIEIPPGTEFVDASGLAFDPLSLQVEELLDVRACWSLEAESVALMVLRHAPPDAGILFPIPPAFPQGVVPFGALDNINGVDFLSAHIPDFEVRPEAIVRTEANPIDGIPFADAVNSGLFDGGAHVEIFGRSEGGLATIDDILILELESFFDGFEFIREVDEQTCTVRLGEADLLIDDTTVFIDVDRASLSEGTPLAIQIDFQSQTVFQVEALDEARDYSALISAGFESDVGLFFVNFVDIDEDPFGPDVFRSNRRELTSIAAEMTIVDDETGQDVSDGFDLQSLVGQFVRVRRSIDASLAPTELIVEIGLLEQPIDEEPSIETAVGVVGSIDEGLTGEVSLSFAIREVVFTPETLDNLGNPFDPATLVPGDVLSMLVCWTTEGEASATKVLGAGELPLGMPGLEFPFGSIGQLPDGRQTILAKQETFAVAADAVVGLGDSPDLIPFAEAVSSGQLRAGQEVEVVLEVTPGVGARLLELFVLEDESLDGLGEPFVDVAATFHDIDLESCTAAVQFEPIFFDPATPFFDAAGNVSVQSRTVGSVV